MDTTTIREVLSIGRYKLKDEEEILKNRSDRKARLKWLRSHGADQLTDGCGKSQDVPSQAVSAQPPS